jgi:RNA polymerase sigma-54 factor
MALMQRMDLRQGQSLVMTPQLQQAIKLLQMSNLELQAFVEVELERNPLLALERDERTDVQKTESPDERANGGDTVTELSANESQEERLRTLDTDLENVYTHEARADASSRESMGPTDSGWASLRPTGGISLDSDEYDFSASLSKAKTLAEHLTDQLNLNIAGASDRIIGQNLIGMVNEAGYLTEDISDIANYLGTSREHVARVLEKLKTFEPVGVFAADAQECLGLQLRERNRLDPAMATLIANLNLVHKRDFSALKSLCKVDLEDIKEMIAELLTLNPWPGHAFGSEPIQPVVPDVYVRAAQDGSWLVELNNDTLPRVLLSNEYSSKVSKTTSREEDKNYLNYLNERQTSATWLIKSLDQRAKTILKVAREIVRQQDAFLVLGVQHLRPINLKTVAEAIEMHESTVSRVTSNKYMATPRGTYELKYFFTTAIASSTAGGDSHSAESVRQRIKDMIAAEVPKSILSDDTIVEILKVEGIEIARRTVAKYRESLNIPSSIQRRRIARSETRQSG